MWPSFNLLPSPACGRGVGERAARKTDKRSAIRQKPSHAKPRRNVKPPFERGCPPKAGGGLLRPPLHHSPLSRLRERGGGEGVLKLPPLQGEGWGGDGVGRHQRSGIRNQKNIISREGAKPRRTLPPFQRGCRRSRRGFAGVPAEADGGLQRPPLHHSPFSRLRERGGGEGVLKLPPLQGEG